MYKFRSKVSDEIKKENTENIDDDNEEENKILTPEENERKKKAEQYVQSSFNNFLLHLKDGEQAYQKDSKDSKRMDIHSYNRDLIWFFFLGILPYNDSSKWNNIITEQRSRYDNFKKKLITKDINDFIEAKKEKEKYALYYKFKEILPKEDYSLLDLIKVDVKRTFQKIELFLLDKIQKILTTVLYIFAKNNKDIAYKQGMSELCAVFLYVLYKEQVLRHTFIKDKDSFLFFVFHSNNNFLENDTFILFERFMSKGFTTFFKYTDEQYCDGELSILDSEKKRALTRKEILRANDSDLKKRIYLLYYDKFPLIDKNLYQFLSEKIEPEIFIIKWYICAFTREFQINKVVHLWDLILLYEYIAGKIRRTSEKNKKIKDSNNINKKNNIDIEDNKNINSINIENDKVKDSNNLNSKNDDERNLNRSYIFMDYIALSMILKIKNLILKTKNTSQLTAFLMKYPQDIDLYNICKTALDIFYKFNQYIKE